MENYSIENPAVTMRSGPNKDRATLFHLATTCAELVDRTAMGALETCEGLTHSRNYPLHFRTMRSSPSKDLATLFHMAMM